METIAIYNDENVSGDEISSLRHRQAVRAVIFDAENNVALLHVESRGYYNLPGGGIEAGEDPRQAIIQECREEIGCVIEITAELGKALEYRRNDAVLNESFGYIGKVIGDKGERLLIGDENEAEKDAAIVWVPLDEAIRLWEQTPRPEKLYSRYVLARDLAFLKKARILLST